MQRPSPTTPYNYYASYGVQGVGPQENPMKPGERQGTGDTYSGRSSGILPSGASGIASYRPESEIKGGNLG